MKTELKFERTKHLILGVGAELPGQAAVEPIMPVSALWPLFPAAQCPAAIAAAAIIIQVSNLFFSFGI